MKNLLVWVSVRIYIISITIIAITVFIISCEKKTEIIGLELVEGEKLFVGLDTTFVLTGYSLPEDTTRTDQSTRNLVGSQFCPVFGRTVAGFYSQVRLSVNAPDFGESPVTDSVKLTMIYDGYYGKLSTQLNMKIFEISEDFYIDSAYYSFSSLNTGDQLGELQFHPAPNDSLIIDSVPYAPRLEVPLSNEFGDRMLNASESDLIDNEAFLTFFKGIYATVDPVYAQTEGSILYFNVLNAASRITIYYNDSLQFDLNINESSARFNRFTHEYSLSGDPGFIDQVINGDTTLGSGKLYLQGMSGINTKVYFPGVIEWATENKYVINQATLNLPVKNSGIQAEPPEKLLAYRIEDSGTETYIEDQFEGDAYIGGDYSSTSNSYQFRISLYLQRLVSGLYNDNGLVLKVSSRTVKANGTVLHGFNQEMDQKIKLRIIYTELD